MLKNYEFKVKIRLRWFFACWILIKYQIWLSFQILYIFFAFNDTQTVLLQSDARDVLVATPAVQKKILHCWQHLIIGILSINFDKMRLFTSWDRWTWIYHKSRFQRYLFKYRKHLYRPKLHLLLWCFYFSHINFTLNVLQVLRITFLPQIKDSIHLSSRYRAHTNVFVLEPFLFLFVVICCIY